MKAYDVLITGGGVSGLTAAIFAGKYGAKAAILEGNDKCGKKILSTGNGRCNFTNEKMDEGFYNTDGERDLITRTLSSFSKEDTLEFMKSIGINPVIRFGTGYYPSSMQATSVRNALEEKALSYGTKIFTGKRITTIKKEKGLFVAVAEDGSEYFGKHVILCTGGMAFKKSGSDGSGYELSKSLHHSLIKPVPSLTSVKCREDFFKNLHGVRSLGKVSVFISDYDDLNDEGEIQFTKEGISGIPVFQFSGLIGRALLEGENVDVSLDLLSHMRKEEIISSLVALKENTGEYKKANTLLDGYLPYQLSEVIITLCNIKKDRKIKTLKDEDIERAASLIKDFRVTPVAVGDFDNAQVTSGGVPLSEIDPGTLESKRMPGLYFAGEIMDADGPCGGYNMQWAISTGAVAGRKSAERIERE